MTFIQERSKFLFFFDVDAVCIQTNLLLAWSSSKHLVVRRGRPTCGASRQRRPGVRREVHVRGLGRRVEGEAIGWRDEAEGERRDEHHAHVHRCAVCYVGPTTGIGRLPVLFV